MQLPTVCLQVDELQSFIAGSLTDHRASEVESHLSVCESCRDALQGSVGDQDWWNDLESALNTSPDEDFASEEDESREENHDRLLELLGPTDDPKMLGRIGSYEIIALLGQGGMGAVFKAFDRSLNRYVAIKMLLPHLAASGASRKRFAREAQAAAAVVDDHVMAIHGVSEWKSTPYFVMPYSRGISLQKRLSNEGPLEVREILRIGLQIAKGLAAAHTQGLVHRDVKPANIFLDEGVERVQLMDFGLARAVDDASLTRSGVLAGTPQYMSPEQARAEKVDHRSDLFSLGSVLYAMCVGHAPFRAESSHSVLRLITDKEPRPIREVNADIPEWLCAIIGKLMCKQADNRFDSSEEIAKLLEDCLAHVQEPTVAPLPAPVAYLAKNFGPRSDDSRPTKTLGGFRYPPVKKLIAAGFLSFLLLAGIFITLEISKGTITIESEADNVPIVIKKGGKVYDRLTVNRDGKSIRVYAGVYEVTFDGDPKSKEIDDGSVALSWGEDTVVTIRETSRVASDVTPSTSKPLTPEEATERGLLVVPGSTRASAQRKSSRATEETVQILVRGKDADRQEYHPNDRIDVYVLANGQSEPAEDEKPALENVVVQSWGQEDASNEHEVFSPPKQSIVVKAPADSVLLAPENELLQDLHRQGKIRFYVRMHDRAKADERRPAKKTNLSRLLVQEGRENEPFLQVEWDVDEGISWLFSDSPVRRNKLGSFPYCFNIGPTGACIVPMIDTEDRRIRTLFSMECQDANDQFWESIRGKKIEIRVNRRDFKFVADGGTIRMVIYLPVRDGVFGDKLDTLTSTRDNSDALKLAKERGQPVVSVRMTPPPEARPTLIGTWRLKRWLNDEMQSTKAVQENTVMTIDDNYVMSKTENVSPDERYFYRLLPENVLHLIETSVDSKGGTETRLKYSFPKPNLLYLENLSLDSDDDVMGSEWERVDEPGWVIEAFDEQVPKILRAEAHKKALLGKWWITGIVRSVGVNPGGNVLGDGRGRAELTFHADGRLQFLRSDGKTRSWRYGMDDKNLMFISGDDEVEAPFTPVFKWVKLPEGYVMLFSAIDDKSTRHEFLLQRLEEPPALVPENRRAAANDSLAPGDMRNITKERLVGEWRAINDDDTWLSCNPDGTYTAENRKPGTSHVAMNGRWRLDGRKLTTSIEGDDMPSWKFIGTSSSICALDNRRLVIRIPTRTKPIVLFRQSPAPKSNDKKMPKNDEQAPHAIFAPIDGDVVQVVVNSNAGVSKGDVLLRLRNVALEAERYEIAHQLQSLAAEVDSGVPSVAEKQQLEDLGKKKSELDKKTQALIIRAPVDGVVVTRDLKQTLKGRKVKTGDVLLRIDTFLDAEDKTRKESAATVSIVFREPETDTVLVGAMHQADHVGKVDFESGGELDSGDPQVPGAMIGVKVIGNISNINKKTADVHFNVYVAESVADASPQRVRAETTLFKRRVEIGKTVSIDCGKGRVCEIRVLPQGSHYPVRDEESHSTGMTSEDSKWSKHFYVTGVEEQLGQELLESAEAIWINLLATWTAKDAEVAGELISIKVNLEDKPVQGSCVFTRDSTNAEIHITGSSETVATALPRCISHAFLARLTDGPLTERWFWLGTGQLSEPKERQAMYWAELQVLHKENRLLPLADMLAAQQLPNDEKDQQRLYAQSMAFCQFIIDTNGRTALLKLARQPPAAEAIKSLQQQFINWLADRSRQAESTAQQLPPVRDVFYIKSAITKRLRDTVEFAAEFDMADGLKPQMILPVKRGETQIGQIQITTLDEEQVYARIIDEKKETPIQAGDVAYFGITTPKGKNPFHSKMLERLSTKLPADDSEPQAITSSQLQRANDELSALRKRLNLIDVTDTNQMAARRLPSSGRFVNHWQVRVPNPSVKRLYVNCGTKSLEEVRDPNEPNCRSFELTTDPDTLEGYVKLRFVDDPSDPDFGSLSVQTDVSISQIDLKPEVLALFTADKPAGSSSVSDYPTVVQSNSPLTLYWSESKSGPQASFCLWIDDASEQQQ